MKLISHSIRNKLLAITGAGTVLFSAAVLFSMWSSWHAINSFEYEVAARHQDEVLILESQREFKKQVQEWKDVLLRGSDKASLDKYWGHFEKQEAAVQDKVKQLLVDEDNAEVRALVEQFGKAHIEMGVAYRKGLQAFREGGYQAGDAAVKGMDRPPTEILTKAAEKIQALSADISRHTYRDSMRNTYIGLALMLAAILAAFAMFVTLVKLTIIEPTTRLVSDLERLSAGDLSVPIQHTTQDEIGMLANSAERVRNDLGRMLRKVEEITAELNHSSQNLVEHSGKVVSGSHQQSDFAQSAAASVEEIAVSIASVAENAESVNRLAQESMHSTLAGNRKLAELLDEMGRVEAAVNTIAESVAEFLKSTTSITTLTGEVRDIADQTNLLALNAAIEAARAGETGRGFAVVADEVRKLAEKSSSTATQIDQVALGMGQRSAQVKTSIENGISALRASETHMDEVATLLNVAKDSVERASSGIDMIAQSVIEQKMAANEIARNVERIARMAESNEVEVHENDRVSSNVGRLAGMLHMEASGFRL